MKSGELFATEKAKSNFNALNTDLNDEYYYPSDIYERTKDNPNFDYLQ
jgi:hypothetical protein